MPSSVSLRQPSCRLPSRRPPESAPAAGKPQAAVEVHRASIERVGKETREANDKGQVRSLELARIHIEGMGSKELEGVIEDDPASMGGLQKATITEKGAASAEARCRAPRRRQR